MIRLCCAFLFLAAFWANAACTGCSSFGPGINWGMVLASTPHEASGMAASARNPGVLWTHNDGPRSRIYALSTNGSLLATCNFGPDVGDFEDIAVGGGFIYIGDIGGSQFVDGTRPQIRILRTPEPSVSLDWAANPVSIDLGQIENFTFQYPDGSYDAETLWFDALSDSIFVVTKGTSVARVYRAHPPAPILELVTTVEFPRASGGDVSPDGSQIALRREEAAMLWARCDGEPLGGALARAGQGIPVIGLPDEPNGEALAFLPGGAGYVTISEGANPIIYFFQSTCPAPPQFTAPLADQTGVLGGQVRFNAAAAGYPPPAFEWRFKGELLPHETNWFLIISDFAPAHTGVYEITASNIHGTATSAATLTITTKPDLRITEVQSVPTSPTGVSTADWWELTSFEDQPVSLAGWRFNDSGGGLTDPFIFPQGLTINPRESIVFVEALTAAQFRAWWGIPATVRIIAYTGNGLSFGANGDGVRLWNNVTVDPLDTVAAANFGDATVGVTFNYDPVTGQFGAPSQFGVNGVFRAAAANDIGSPGRILAPPSSPVLEPSREGNTLRIAFDASVGRRYSLELMDEKGWSPTGDEYHATSNTRASFDKPITSGHRFFRVRVE